MKPILFNTEMVRAILDGRKSVTRRDPFQTPPDYDVLKGLYRDDKGRLCALFQCRKDPTTETAYARYDRGDVLWVRETWTTIPDGSYFYKASVECPDAWKGTWRPSIHMPKEAARIFLQVKEVRVERLQEMTLKDTAMEGMDLRGPMFTKFVEVWNSTVPKHPNKFKRYPYYWEDNPWVWVISFEWINRPTVEEKEKT